MDIKLEYMRMVQDGKEVLCCLSNECCKPEEHKLFHYLGCECPCRSELHVVDTIPLESDEEQDREI